jgi:hypothetical protein
VGGAAARGFHGLNNRSTCRILLVELFHEKVFQALPTLLDDLLRYDAESFALEKRSGRSAGFGINSAKPQFQSFAFDAA